MKNYAKEYQIVQPKFINDIKYESTTDMHKKPHRIVSHCQFFDDIAYHTV